MTLPGSMCTIGSGSGTIGTLWCGGTIGSGVGTIGSGSATIGTL